MKINLKLGEKNKFSSAMLLIFLVLIITGVLSFVILGLRHFNLFALPQFIEDLLFRRHESAIEEKNDDRDIYNFLESENPSDEPEGYVHMFDVTLENIREVIDNIVFPENIYILSRAEYYYKDSVSKIMETSLWKKGEKFRYFLTVNSRREDLYINDGTNEYIQNYVSEKNVTRKADELFSFKDVPHIQDISHYLDLLESAEIVSCAVVRYSDSYDNVAHIKYRIPELNQRENIYISLDTGIVLEVRSYYGNGNELYYKYIADVREAYNDISQVQRTAIDDDLFVIPK